MYQVALRLSYAMVVACTNRVVAKQRPLSSILVGRLPHVLTAVRGTRRASSAPQRNCLLLGVLRTRSAGRAAPTVRKQEGLIVVLRLPLSAAAAPVPIRSPALPSRTRRTSLVPAGSRRRACPHRQCAECRRAN